ncbi:unnamed protein product [Rotaria sp. Silwood2]|nr:unnamed protein product [Rotaria sp. Silwood2]CAF2680155.1 unnamed protein product [Rotaria sp. Silwood2]CAF2951174.1 unnamed protein product [Rotaria sp. Silwood2]CAF3127533.1 unnamed protein product [Rotaria sp. Silwood2]CAF4066989.1 unnamed protein product [Rotaria sp. Silwood2]
MKLFFFVITLIIYQYFISRIATDARPMAVKKFSWAYPIHEYEEDDYVPPLVKRKGVGWGKRSDLMSIDHPYAINEDSARMWFDEK